MTTFQDPQPQSRRAVRQSERGETFETPIPAPLVYPEATPPSDTWDTVARRAAQLPPSPPRSDVPAVSGRRAVQSQEAPLPEPLNYSTQGGLVAPLAQPLEPQPPAQQLFRRRGTAVPPVDQAPVDQAPVDQAPVAPAPSAPTPAAAPAAAEPAQSDFRVRDYSPEAGRVTAPQSWADVAPTPSPAPEPSDLDYRTEARLHYEVPVAPVGATHGVPIEQTLTRRELRAQLAMEQQREGSSVFPSAPEPNADTALTNAIAEFDALTQQAAAEQAAWAAEQASLVRAAQEQAAAQQAAQLVTARQAPPPMSQSAPPAVHQAEEPSAWTPPLGHWSTQSLADDGEPYENTINHTVGSGTAATSALVIPTVPGSHDIRGPLTSTGEIMLTGSIDLPRSFSSTGASARFDPEGIDAFFDAGDAEVISTDSAPVRAISAVSTHNSGQGVTHTQKPKGTRALTVLLIAASSMAVIVAGLLITAFALNIF